tara:strand:- start:240 stop:506 length:267 start_codon:yes stop_codon:yes gene_type:complete
MDLSIAKQFLKFKEEFFKENNITKKLIKTLKQKNFSLEHQIKALQDQVYILQIKIEHIKERNEEAAIKDWLSKFQLDENGYFIDDSDG